MGWDFWSTANARASGSAVALDAGQRQRTYAELEAEVGALAGWLAGCAGPVAVLASDPWWTIPALLAALAAGVPYAPLDPSWPTRRLEAVLTELQPGAVLVAPGLATHDALLVGLERADLSEINDLAPRAAVARAPGAPTTVFFTSGSTGQPKGILGRPGAIEHFLAWERDLLHAGPGLRVSALAPPSFDAALRDALLPLSVGGTVCLPPDRTVVADGARLAAWLAAARVQVVHTVPTVFRGVLQQPSVHLPDLQAVLLAGEVLRPADAARFFAHFGDRVALYNLYGPTETTMIKLCHRVTPADLAEPSIPLGTPLPDTEVFVLDAAGRARPADRVGEIALRTPWCALGYLGQPEATARAFVPDGLGDGSPIPLYRTGDLGIRRADGALEFRGRRDHQVKLRGVRVELEEVEAAIAAAPGVAEAVTALRDGPDGEPRLVAWVVGAPTDLLAHLAAALPPALHPSQVVLVASLPRLLNGKVDRAALALPPPRTEAVDAPEGPIELRICSILKEILSTEVGATDDFFSLGGDSLHALRAVWRLNEALGIELPIDTLYHQRSVRALAPVVEQTMALASAQPALPAAPTTFQSTVLRPGTPVVFWLPPSYGISLPYRTLVPNLPGGAVALDLRTGATSLEALGAAACTLIRPHGPPWTLAGWSFGGVLAFEVARQLAADGHGVRLLLLDSAAPTEPFDFAAGDARLAALAARRLGELLGRPLHLDPAALAGLSPEDLMGRILDLAAEHGVPITPAIRREAATVMATRAATMAAWRRYHPPPWPGQALVVRSEDAEVDWTARWSHFITGPLTRVVVPGDHNGMLDQADPTPLIEALTAALTGSTSIM